MEYTQTSTPYRGFFAGLFSNYSEARVEQFRTQLFAKTVRQLERLSDKQLDDIGVPRDQIKQRAYQSVYEHVPYGS